MYRKTWAEIQKDALQYNIDLIRKNFSQDTFLCPMVKANAYGHGDVKLGSFFQDWGLKSLGVCLIEEGLLLRQLDVKTPVLVFRGFDKKGAVSMLQNRMTPVVSTWDQLDILLALGQPTPLHLKFDTGMNRLGFSVEESEKILQKIKDQKFLEVEGVLTHLYMSEDAQSAEGHTANQIQKFKTVSEVFKNHSEHFHVLNSGGIVCKMEMQKKAETTGFLFEQNWGLRPGLLLYGYNPVANSTFQFKPAMTLKSHTSVVRKVKKGEGVSYNHTWVAPKDSLVAVVPIGYADGWHRLLSNKTHVLWNGQRAPLVGNICMDYLMVDVTGLSVEIENEVVFFGQSRTGSQISAADVAKVGQTITWEVLTSVGERVPRVYV